jgi:lipoprotein NlpI
MDAMRLTLRISATVLLALAPFPGRAGESSDDLLKAAVRAFNDGKTKEALALADKAIAVDPKKPRPYLVRGQLRDAAGQYREAVADFTRAVELDPTLAEAHDRLGSSYFKLGEFAKSLAAFDRFLTLKPDERAGHWRRGITCYYAKRFDEGRKQFEGYEKVDANDVENAVWRYLCMVPLVGVEKARAAMLKVGMDKRVPMMEIYDLFRGKLKPADVLKAAEAGAPPAEQLNRRRFYAHLYLGLYHESLGDAKRALGHLTTATEHHIGHYMWDVARVARNSLLRAPTKK